MSSWTESHFLTSGDKKVTKEGNFMEPDATELLNLHMLRGTQGWTERNFFHFNFCIHGQRRLFGDADPMNKVVRMNDKLDAKVTGVYEDFPRNSNFANVNFIVYLGIKKNQGSLWMAHMDWGNNAFQIFVQIADNANMDAVSRKIKDAKLANVDPEDRRYHPQLFLHPMSKWHLYGEFKNGVNTGGAIQYVWLFGIIGVFVLILACINFMNLSTARSQKRAREVGIRKAVGSLRQQLIGQFYMESILVAFLAFLVCAGSNRTDAAPVQ